MPANKKNVENDMTPETKCSFCTQQICCTYTTQEIDTPRAIDDFDHMLWQMTHQGIHQSWTKLQRMLKSLQKFLKNPLFPKLSWL